jgi:hypothetical protein
VTTIDEALGHVLRSRGVRDPCESCRGLGTRLYGSGSTWRGGMGTASMEYDVCDVCWGSGDKFRHGEDLRKLRDEEADRVAKLAREYLFKDLVDLTVLAPGIEEFCAEVDKLNNPRSRKPRKYGFDTVCSVVVKRLRKAL